MATEEIEEEVVVEGTVTGVLSAAVAAVTGSPTPPLPPSPHNTGRLRGLPPSNSATSCPEDTPVDVLSCEEVNPVVPLRSDGRPLCASRQHVCYSRPLEGQRFCKHHILEEEESGDVPFTRCSFTSPTTNQRCTRPVSIRDKEPRYCPVHYQALGLAKRTRSGAGSIVTTGAKKQVDDASESYKAKRQRLSAVLHKFNIEPGNPIPEDASSSFESDAASLSFGGPVSSSAGEDSDACKLPDDDGSSDDSDCMRGVSVFAEEEVLRRKRERMQKLLTLYQSQFSRLRRILHERKWKLMHKAHENERRKAKTKEESHDKNPAHLDRRAQLLRIYRLRHARARGTRTFPSLSTRSKLKALGAPSIGADVVLCAFRNSETGEPCRARPMPLSQFCFSHILQDSNQQLYQQCTYSASGTAPCTAPILITADPPLCHLHLQKGPPRPPSSPIPDPPRLSSEMPQQRQRPSMQPLPLRPQEKMVTIGPPRSMPLSSGIPTATSHAPVSSTASPPRKYRKEKKPKPPPPPPPSPGPMTLPDILDRIEDVVWQIQLKRRILKNPSAQATYRAYPRGPRPTGTLVTTGGPRPPPRPAPLLSKPLSVPTTAPSAPSVPADKRTGAPSSSSSSPPPPPPPSSSSSSTAPPSSSSSLPPAPPAVSHQ